MVTIMDMASMVNTEDMADMVVMVAMAITATAIMETRKIIL